MCLCELCVFLAAVTKLHILANYRFGRYYNTELNGHTELATQAVASCGRSLAHRYKKETLHTHSHSQIPRCRFTR